MRKRTQQPPHQTRRPISGTLPIALYDRVKASAEREHRTFVDQLRHIVAQYYEREDAAHHVA